MTVANHLGAPEPRSGGRRPEPRWMTLADLGVMVAAVALLMTIPSPALGLPPFVAPQMALLIFAVLGSVRLGMGFGLVLASVVTVRHARYAGPVRPAEWLALALASTALLNVVPNLDEAVNAYYVAVGSTALDFGVARWLLSAPAAAGVAAVAAGLVLLRHRACADSRFASALTAVGIVAGLFLWFWGPCEVSRLQLPWLLVPSPQGDVSSWGWRLPVVQALRELVANGLIGMTWGLLAAATVRAWRNDRSSGQARGWVWTERAAVADAVVVALLTAAGSGVLRPIDTVRWAPMWIVTFGLVAWWITGRLGPWCDKPAPVHAPPSAL